MGSAEGGEGSRARRRLGIGRRERLAGRALRGPDAAQVAGLHRGAALTLALGIGATTAIFSLLDAVMLKSLPVRIQRSSSSSDRAACIPVFPRLSAAHRHLRRPVCHERRDTARRRSQAGVRERTDVSLVSGSYFLDLGVQAAIGRTFGDDDDRTPGEHPVAVASDGYWQRRFGGDAAILDRVVRINGTPITISRRGATWLFRRTRRRRAGSLGSADDVGTGRSRAKPASESGHRLASDDRPRPPGVATSGSHPH